MRVRISRLSKPWTTLSSVLLCSLLISAARAQERSNSSQDKDVDITAPDGAKLRATYFPAAKPGPAVLLMHMCNTVRSSWEPVAKQLRQAGISALTVDNRGFGESAGPRFEGGSPDVQKELRDKWPGDFEAAYQYLVTQPGVDKARVSFGGASCGMTNALKLAEEHPDVKSLVLLAGGTDLAGIDFILKRNEIPIFTAAAADDEYSPATVQLMQWFEELSGNPRSKFEGYPNGRHGTEIFATHPELVQHVVEFFQATLTGSAKEEPPRKTVAAELWTTASQPQGADKAVELFHQAKKNDPKAQVFPEFPLNLLAYDRLRTGDKKDAVTLFKLNAEAYPASANAQDSLSDGYIALGDKQLALAAEEKCLQLLPADPSLGDFKAQLQKVAEDKVATLKESAK